MRPLRRLLRFLLWRARTWYHETRYGFDRRFGTDTVSLVPVAELGLDAAAAESAESYAPCPAPWVLALIAELPIDPREFVFVDLGSGKGRVLLLASSSPFRRIVGVEASPRLHAIAERNLARYRSGEQRCFALEARLGDARAFVPPDDNTVVFLFNPFGPDVIAALLDHLDASLRARPRELFVLYAWPVHAELFQRPGVERVGGRQSWHLYRMRAQ